MSVIEVTVQVRKDGAVFPGFPVTRRVEAEAFEGFDYAKEEDLAGVYENLPVTQALPASVVVVKVDREVTVRLAGQTDAGVVLPAGGMLIILGSNIEDAPVAALNNVSGGTAKVVGLVAGESPA